jgi:hypothetical protein
MAIKGAAYTAPISSVQQNANTQQQAAGGPSAAPQRPVMDFHSGGLFGSPIARSSGSDYYNKLKNALTEIYKNANEGSIVDIIDLDNTSEPALMFSSMIVTIRYKHSPEFGVAYHVLLLEATGDKITPLMDNTNGMQIEILRVAGDAMDGVLFDLARDRVQRTFPNYPIFLVNGCVVPAAFNPEDQYAVYRLALNAGLAGGTELAIRDPNFQDLNLQPIVGDSNLSVNLGFNKSQIEDAVGQPMRSDVLINFSSKRDNKGRNQSERQSASLNAGNQEVKISEASCFIDLLWNPGQHQHNAFAPQMQVDTRKYVPRLVITNLVSNSCYSIGSVLLALATTVNLRNADHWYQAFKPVTYADREIDMCDIGALNIEANLFNEPSANGYGTRVKTKDDTFKLDDLGQFLRALVREGMIVSLDCPEAGPQTWYTSIFAAASANSQDAYNIIINAANQLTNNNFQRHFTAGTAMFSDFNNRIHNGYWRDKNGAHRDLRDFDHLAVCNLVGDRNPQFIRDWSDTFLRTTFPLAQRLAARKKMIMALSGETAVFTGFSQRVTFSAAFLMALDSAIADTGISVMITTPLSASDFNNLRGEADFANTALFQPSQSFMSVGARSHQPHLNQQYHQYRYG